jgi:hypothetical protein
MVRTNPKQNEDREEPIAMEVIVDAYGPEEQAMGWYYYLEEKLRFTVRQGNKMAYKNFHREFVIRPSSTFPPC